MSADEVSKTWFEKYPKLFEKQSDILKSFGFQLNQEALSKHRQIIFEGHSKVDPQRQLIVAFPQAFPSCAPKIFDTPSSKLLTRHHRNDSRQLCLFSFGENNWNASLSVADALAEAENLISKFKAGSAVLENQPPEPLTRAIQYIPNAAMLVPPPISTFKDFAKLNSLVGRFSAKFVSDGEFKRETRGRGVILEANFGAQRIHCSPQFSKYFGNNGTQIIGDWFYLQTPPTLESLPAVLTKCFQKIAGVKKAPFYWLALIFDEEAGGNSQSRLTWLIVRANAAGHFHINAQKNLLENQQSLASLQRQIQKVRDEMNQTHRLYLEGQITAQGFGQFYKPTEERLNQLLSELPRLEAEASRLKVEQVSAEEVIHEAKTLYAQWPKLDADRKRSIVEAVFERIESSEGKLTITYSGIPSSEELCNNQQQMAPATC
jgi:hypothetical protein